MLPLEIFSTLRYHIIFNETLHEYLLYIQVDLGQDSVMIGCCFKVMIEERLPVQNFLLFNWKTVC